MSFIDYVPGGSGISKVYGFDPTVWDPFLEFTHHLMRGPSPLTVAQRELIAAYTSALSDCAYCSGAHGASAAALGFSRETQDKVLQDLHGADLPEDLRTLLIFVRKLVLTPTQLVREDVAAVLGAGWSELAFNHAVGIASRYVMATRMSFAHGIVLSPGELEEAGARMAAPDWGCMPAGRG